MHAVTELLVVADLPITFFAAIYASPYVSSTRRASRTVVLAFDGAALRAGAASTVAGCSTRSALTAVFDRAVAFSREANT